MGKAKKVFSVLGVAAVAILLASSLSWTTLSNREKDNVLEAIEQLVQDEGEEDRSIDWDSLPEEVVAWVEVPGTSIDEPVAKASSNSPNAYLYEDAFGQGAYGTPYIDCECSLDTPFVIIYGHHMSDGSAFADFAKFIDEDYVREHGDILLYKRDSGTLHLRPVAVDVVNASRETLVINHELAPAERIASADLLLEGDLEADQLFAFATCSYQTSNSRTVVYAAKG